MELEKIAIGFSLGNIYAGNPSCADDTVFIEYDGRNLQVMFNFLDNILRSITTKCPQRKPKL